MALLTYDLNNLLAERIGPQGVALDAIRALEPQLQEAFARVRELRKNKTVGFFDLPDNLALCDEIEGIASELRSQFDNFVVIGIGGSALGNIAIHSAINHPEYNLLPRETRKGLRLFVPDNIDPDRLRGVLDVLDPKRTCFNVITKSGNTAESIATFLIAREWVMAAVGEKSHARHFIFTTDPEKGELRKISPRFGYRCLPIPPTVGGRFSVLSAVGLLSAAVTGVNIRALFEGARAVRESQKFEGSAAADVWRNPALLGAGLHYLLDVQKKKNIHIMYSYSHRLRDVADWFRQLWAESLGKKLDKQGKEVHVGQTPEKAVGVTDQHSQVQLYVEGPFDKVITFLSVEKFESDVIIPRAFDDLEGFAYLGNQKLADLFHYEERATRLVLTQAGRPNCTLRVPKVSEQTLGALFFLLELQTAYIGELYGIDTYNQPGVEEGKNFAYGLLGRKGYEAKKAEFDAAKAPDPKYVLSV
ncbi:MAG: glucose-6-phosphate isomerase [Verrucomicrobiae bacterium]|nr:glucose-6-phosphate isomerase [Verrucomicrobiae bacterium]